MRPIGLHTSAACAVAGSQCVTRLPLGAPHAAQAILSSEITVACRQEGCGAVEERVHHQTSHQLVSRCLLHGASRQDLAVRKRSVFMHHLPGVISGRQG